MAFENKTTVPQLAVYEQDGMWHWAVTWHTSLAKIGGHGFDTREDALEDGRRIKNLTERRTMSPLQ